MCGILFYVRALGADGNASPSDDDIPFELLKEANALRGPDASDSVERRVDSKLRLDFFSSELYLRGDHPVSQPHVDSLGNTLCWNGEIFEGFEVASDENDGSKLLAGLANLQDPDDIVQTLGRIEGPYALVYHHNASGRLFFARDPLGRRSLLLHKPSTENPYFMLTSVSAGANTAYDLVELSTDYIYSLDLAKLAGGGDLLLLDACLTPLPRRLHTFDGDTPYATPAAVNRTLPDDPPKVDDLENIPPHLVFAVEQLISHLDMSVQLMVRNIPPKQNKPGQARVAVLFSGGIDSTVLAYLADRHAAPEEPIDLLNVAFENPRKITVQTEGNVGALPKREKKLKLRDPLDYSTVTVSYNVPDRMTGLQEVEELRKLCPNRTWNFVEINVPYEESQSARTKVEAVMCPSRTIMDLSLAIALYFAARGVGQIRSSKDASPLPYTSPAKVLLNGLGSDELLGGYGRHRTAFKAGGWQAVIDELQLEIDRIPTRNLGRDDRIISSWGKETRHPFLSLRVVSFLAGLPVHMKMDPRLEVGIGEKLLLRLAARKLGLVEASGRKKRAMQFGSHSARMAPGEWDRKGDVPLHE